MPSTLDELYPSNPQATAASVASVDYAKLETATLAHVDDTYYYGGYCRKCGHHARISLVKLRAHLGDTFPLVKVREKLKCDRCGHRRQIVVTFLTPAQRTGSLVHLFERELK